ncbi:pentapeptide repeat-containing protein [Rhodococcus sp. BUPNP1]|uniref:pentapeptide repeat-containing protein n=1 Tax=Rhodococcus sp. BUPNP1 TaxID=1432786 RepID=UPI000B5A5E66|nr:pentapeptide repeat-containing protein [Rhodococcus sp. BUPNP1]OWY83631.1 low-complexity protein [Rhodococcus sp. BUPNP1]
MAARSTTRPPRIDAPDLGVLTDTDGDELHAHGIFESVRYTGTDLTGRDLTGIVLSECSLVASIVADSDLTNARLRDTLVERMQAPNLFAPRSSLHRVHIRDSRIGALDLFDADLRSVTIADSKLGLVNLRAATGRDVLFRGCILDELDLGGGTFTRVAFEDCSVGVLDLDRATLDQVDLRGLRIDTIRNMGGMKGATIDAHQAVALAGQFAAHLGLRIEDLP